MFKPTHTLTANNAKTVLEAGLRAIAAGQTRIDLTHVTAVDSTAVATLLAWQRAALSRGMPLLFVNIPSNLQNLAGLYDVTDLLGASSFAPSAAAALSTSHLRSDLPPD